MSARRSEWPRMTHLRNEAACVSHHVSRCSALAAAEPGCVCCCMYLLDGATVALVPHRYSSGLVLPTSPPDAQVNQKLRCDFAGVGASALHPAVLRRDLVWRLQRVL